jgi:hypothetical protein
MFKRRPKSVQNPVKKHSIYSPKELKMQFKKRSKNQIGSADLLRRAENII